MTGKWLDNLGLHRRELRAWAMYDWANSAFITMMITIFPLFLRDVASAGLPEGSLRRSLWPLLCYSAIVVSSVVSLLLGPVADALGAIKKILFGLTVAGSAATAGMWFVQPSPGYWVLLAVLYLVATIAITCAFVLYNALLPHIASDEEADRVSSGGFALGYLGGGLALVIALAMNLLMADKLLAVSITFAMTGAWWFLFSLPLFRHVPEPEPILRTSAGDAIRQSGTMLIRTLREIKSNPNLVWFLLAFMLYSDGISTIVRMAVDFGDERKLDRTMMIAAILATQVVGVPFAFLFGYLTRFIAAKRLVIFGVCVYVLISLLGFVMSTGTHFLLLAMLVGSVQGGTQALSRSMFARMIPREKSGEYFSVFGILDRFSGSIGMGTMALAGPMTGSSRYGVLGVSVMFILGALLMTKVRTKVRTAEPVPAGVE